jgi:hypothetical protein
MGRRRDAMRAAVLGLLMISSLASFTSGETTRSAAPRSPAAFDSSAALAKARQLHQALRINDATRLWQDFNEPMRVAMGNLEGFEKTLKDISAQTGRLEECLQEGVEFREGYFHYRAVCRFAGAPMPLVLTFVFGTGGKVSGFWIRPEAKAHPTPFLQYQTKTPLRLPFFGEWTVAWGGRTIQDNYHAVARDQRFAYDILVVKDTASHAGEGSLNTDYYCFGLPIVAPAQGRVVWHTDGVADNRPGQMNPRQPFGNAVVLDHGNGEFSVLAHFKRGSVRVKRDQDVAEGDTLGLCGNSGNSSEPHLHYHLQNAPDLMAADGMPAAFVDYVANGQPVERGEPVKGERIRRK